jgi:hypothetical protein
MGLALLLHVGSPQSKEGDDRMEARSILFCKSLTQKRKNTWAKSTTNMAVGKLTRLFSEQC